MSGDPRPAAIRPITAAWLATTFLALCAVAFVPAETQAAGASVSATRTITHLAKIGAVAAVGDHQGAQEGVEAFSDEFLGSVRVTELASRDVVRPEARREAV